MIDISNGLHGAYTYRTARHALGDHRLRGAIDEGALVAFGRGVLLSGDRVLDLRTRCAGALLLAGRDAVLVGPTAAALHGCTAVGGFPVHVAVPYDHRVRSRSGLVVHQAALPAAEITTVEGLRVSTLPATIGELLCEAPRRAALACADQALHALPAESRPARWSEIHRYLRARPNRRGTRQAAELLSLATGLPETPAESVLLLSVVEAGFPVPTSHYRPADRRGRPRHRLTFAWPELRIALTYQSPQPRPAGSSWPPPVARTPGGAPPWPPPADLRAQGWLIVSAHPGDLIEPTQLCTRLRAAFAERRCAA